MNEVFFAQTEHLGRLLLSLLERLDPGFPIDPTQPTGEEGSNRGAGHSRVTQTPDTAGDG